MKRICLLTLLATVMSLSSHESLAQARGPLSTAQKVDGDTQTTDPAERAKKIAELETWLQRLVGHFHIEGFAKVFVASSSTCPEIFCYRYTQPQGMGDCERVAADVGLHCVIKMLWPRFPPVPTDYVGNWPGPFLDSAVVLFGIDPESMEIRFLLVDAKSVAYDMFGTPKGDSLMFTSGCVPKPLSKLCERRHHHDGHLFSFHAKPDGSEIEMGLEVRWGNLSYAEYRFNLHHLPQSR